VPITKQSSITSGNTASRSPGTGSFAAYTPLMNDVIVGWFSATTVLAVTMPAGWVSVLGGNTVVASSVHTVCCAYHVVTQAEETAVTVAWTLTNLWNTAGTGNAVCLALRGVDTNNVIDVASTTFNSTAGTTPHVMPGVSGANVSLGAWQISGLTVETTDSYGAAPGGWTFQASSNTNQLQAIYSKNALMVPGTTVADQNITPTTGARFCAITAVFTALMQKSQHLPLAVGTRRAGFY